MPVLLPGDPEFAGFDVNSPFVSALPSEEILDGASVSSFYSNMVAETAVFKQWENFSRGERHAFANIAITSGLTIDRLGALSSFFEQAPKVSISNIKTVIKTLDSPDLQGALLAVDDALEIIGAQVPIVGYAVRIGLFVYETIKAVVSAVKAEKNKTAAKHAIAYKKKRDEELTQDVLDRIKDPSWTLLFMPQGYADDVKVEDLSYTNRGQADGVAWEVYKPNAGNLGWGITPGWSSRFTGVVGLFQSPRKLRGSTRDAGFESITGFGELHPSVVQLGMAIWQRMLKNSPDAFRIKGDRIVRAWHDHYGLLTDFAYRQPSDSWLRKQILYTTRWYLPELDASVVEGSNGELLQPEDLPSKYTDASVWWYSELIAYTVEQLWKPRLRGFLETLTCAYVDPQAQALKEDPDLRQYHFEMRQLLLKHKARHEVELDLIPDADYRSAMYLAKLQIDPVFTTAPKVGPRLPWLDFVPPVDPELPPTPEPEGDPGPGTTPVGGGGGGGGGLVAGVIAAVVLGAIAARRKAG